MGVYRQKTTRLQRRKNKAHRRNQRRIYGVGELIKMPPAQRDMIMNNMTPAELTALIHEAENPSDSLIDDLHAFVEETDEKP